VEEQAEKWDSNRPETWGNPALTITDYLDYHGSEADACREHSRFNYSLIFVFLSVSATAIVALVSAGEPQWVWIAALVVGLLGATWFYFHASYSSWAGFQHQELCEEILLGWLRIPNDAAKRWFVLVREARESHPWFAWWSDQMVEAVLPSRKTRDQDASPPA
jgi:hypothetical protein